MGGWYAQGLASLLSDCAEFSVQGSHVSPQGKLVIESITAAIPGIAARLS